VTQFVHTIRNLSRDIAWHTGDFMIVPRILSSLKHSPNRFAWLQLATILFLSNLFLASCTSLFGGNSGPNAAAMPSELEITQLHWCGKPSMLFRDEGTVATPTTTATATVVPGTPRTISDWSEVEANIGFTVFLPSTLPRNTCLVNAQATIHDPIIGGSFTIGYLLPDHSALSLSEASLISQNIAFQCNPSNGATPQANATPKAGTPTPSPGSTPGVPLLLCSGAKDTTNIVMSARGSTDHLQQIFNNLQPRIPWIPAS
jgi:hypothetical protein